MVFNSLHFVWFFLVVYALYRVLPAVSSVERSHRGEGWAWPIGLEGVREKRYGETMLLYGRVGTSDATPTSPGSS